MREQLRNIVERSRRFLQKRSLQFTISISFTIVTIVGMALIGLSLSMRFVDSTEKMLTENNTRIVDQVNLNLDTYLRDMMRISDSMYYRVIKNADLETDSITDQMSLLYETNRDLLVSLGVFTDDGKMIAAEPVSQLKDTAKITGQGWFRTATGRIENLHFSTPHVEDLYLDPDNKYSWVVSLSRSVELTRAGNITHGVLLVDMNFSGIEQICENVDLGRSGYLYIIDGNGEIIYHPRQELIYSNLNHENNMVAASYEDGTHTETFEGSERLVTVKTVGYTGWKIIAVTPTQAIVSNYSQYTTFVLLIALFGSFLLIFVNMLISSRIANPIKALEKSVKNIENGDLDEEKITIGGSYEVRHLGKTIRSMVCQTRKLMDDVVTEQESKRRSELDALQSQINPHFLYNTLDSIVWMIENEHYQGAVTMVTSLAKLFRISLGKGKNIVTVADEMEHVRNYLKIQNLRYKNKFQFEIDAEPEALGCATIKLIVQPLVENAIYHGLESMDSDGEILIKAYIVGDDLYVDVIDNGLGMPQEQADELLLEETVTVRGKGSGIGLKNIKERIQLYFGEKYGLSLFSEPDEGMTARIHLPVRPLVEPDSGKKEAGK